MKTYQGISAKRLEEIISGITNVRVGLIGDLALDVYWIADMTKSELSRETPHFPLPVAEERMSPGAGGNVLSNIAALKPSVIRAVGVVGNDWRGDVLARILRNLGINTEGITVSGEMVTNAYCKPVRKGISNVEYEDPRIDFANYRPLDGKVEDELLRELDRIIDDIDVLCVSDQFPYGCITERVRDKINSYGLSGKRIVVDSRDRISAYQNVILKPNEVEGYRAVNNAPVPKDINFDGYPQTVRTLAKRNHSDVYMTLGSKGCLYSDGKDEVHIPCRSVEPPIDFCGAGDTFLSAVSCALAAGAQPPEAADFANMAAEVTIKKIGTTGTASAEEIRRRHGSRR